MGAERRILALVLTGAMLIAGAVLTAWFLSNFERRTLEIPIGASAAARRNPFLAAERFLSRLAIPVESRPGRELLHRLPPPTDTLAMHTLTPLAPERRAALRAWIAAGGRLVADGGEVRDDGPHPDDLLGELGIRLQSVAPAGTDCAGETLAEAVAGTGGPVLRVAFSPCWALATAGEGDAPGQTPGTVVAIAAGGHPRLLQVRIGRGLLTVVSDNRFMTNDAIGDRDHALFVAGLLAPPPGGKVWLLYDSAVPWLGALLWDAAPGALIGAAVLIPIWLWSLSARLGPLEPPPDRRRRDLTEHLEATGTFLWDRGLAASLAEPTRKRVLAAWQRRRPELRHLAPRGQAAAIAQATGTPPDALVQALVAQVPGVSDRQGFLDRARTLAGLWHGARPPRHGRQPPAPTHRPRIREGDR